MAEAKSEPATTPIPVSSQPAATPLRFAGYVRVSTDKQEEKYSLGTQRQFVTERVELLHGTLVEIYGGSEHGTEGWDRDHFDRLLKDAKAGKFDAIMVFDLTRWGRDQAKSQEGFNVCKERKIKFFVGLQELDAFSLDQMVLVDVTMLFGKFFADKGSQSALINKINGARLGAPTSGKPPYGRTYNKITKEWGIDEEKQRRIDRAARRYVKGENLKDIAPEAGLSRNYLHFVLTQRCGTSWVQSFGAKRFNINELVPTTIPPLLSEELIAEVLKTSEANRNKPHATPLHQYLLTGKVFCLTCGYALTGQPHRKNIYYRHATRDDAANCPAPTPKLYVNRDELETAVIAEILDFYNTPKRVARAIKEATPDDIERQKLIDRLAEIEEQFAKIKIKRRGHSTAYDNDHLPEDEYHDKLKQLDDRKTKLELEKQGIEAVLSTMPSPEQIKEITDEFGRKRASARLAAERRQREHVDTMTWQDKKDLLDEVFDGVTVDGKRMGVYVDAMPGQTNHRHKSFQFYVRGQFGYRLAKCAPNGIASKTMTAKQREDMERQGIADMEDAVCGPIRDVWTSRSSASATDGSHAATASRIA